MRSRDAAGYGLLLVATTSCLVLGDFQDLEPEGATASSSATTGVTGTTASSSADATSASSGGGGAGSSGTGGGSQSSTGGGGTGGSGLTDPLDDHGPVLTLRVDGDFCEIEVTDWLAEGDQVYIGGVTRGLPGLPAGESCGFIISQPVTEEAAEGEAVAWVASFGRDLGFINQYLVLGTGLAEGANVQLAANGSVLFAAHRPGVVTPTLEVVNFTGMVRGNVHALEANDVLVEDLFTTGGRVYAVGSITGPVSTPAATGCGAAQVDYGTFDDEGYVWSFDQLGTCSLGAFGPDTHVWSASPDPLMLTARGELEFGGRTPCLRAGDGPFSLNILEAVDLGGAGLPGSCVDRSLLGTGPEIPMQLATRGDLQVLGFATGPTDSRLLMRNLGNGGQPEERAFAGKTRIRSVFVQPDGRPGAIGTFDESILFGELSATTADSAAFYVTFDGTSGFTLDGVGRDRLTAALATDDRVYLAGQWQGALPDLGLTGAELGDPYGLATFLTYVRVDAQGSR